MTVYLATFALAGLGQLLDCAIATAIGMTIRVAIVRASINCMSVVLVPICVMTICSSCVMPIGRISVGRMTILLAFAGCYGLLCIGSWISLCKHLESIQDWTVPSAATA